IFGTDTKAGRLFDIVLLYGILISIIVVMLESVKEISDQFNAELRLLEWIFTIGFTIEYLSRLFVAKHPLKYATSFFGIIDLLAIIPSYLTILLPGTQYLLVIRAIRLLRVFRVLKLTRYMGESRVLGQALWSSRQKIIVFLGAVVSIVTISGTVMYVVEGAENGFTSIPRSIYWAVVTLTTVGYGDIAPQTVIGQTFAMVLMLTGYAIIAVPTGIVTSEITLLEKQKREKSKRVCNHCGTENEDDANFCKSCGEKLISYV
ncbi:MAG: ion transporter, partial [Saprospiraceae bacterium]|nr:ion transporter [Saprospiraceae bacterium]